ncbi:protein mono-ADP-ribosyltransferase PARP12 [Penaeus vannamei]|uniref:protein mono-ADP-ribosyltransferase PARP12 n=1 Tax=Penaeus vannamei TaxID=6689 RepID=UPI00387FA56F
MSGNLNRRRRPSPNTSEDEEHDYDYDYNEHHAHSARSHDSGRRGNSARYADSDRRGNKARYADSNRHGNSADFSDSDEYDGSGRHAYSARSQDADRYRDSDRRGHSGRYADPDNYRRKDSQYEVTSESESSDEHGQGAQPHHRRYGQSAHSLASRRSPSESEEESEEDGNQWLVNLLVREPKYKAKILSVIKRGIPLRELENMIQENAHIFQEADECVFLRPQIKICSWHVSARGCSARSSYKCSDLHICSQFISGSCRINNCSKGHDLATAHNVQVLEPYYLRYIDVASLKKILQISLADIESEEDNEPLILCENYNRGKCSDKKCKYLHFCKYHLESKLKCRGRNCTLNHSFVDAGCNDLLEKKGIDTNESPKDLMNEIFRLFPDLEKANRQPSGKSNPSHRHHSPSPSPSPPRHRRATPRAPTTGSHLTIEASELEGNLQILEICSRSLKNNCNAHSCQRLHSDLPFHWQVSADGNNWFNLHKYQVVYLERDFSDPSKTRSVILETKGWSVHKKLQRILGTRKCEVDFEDMLVTSPDSRTPLQLRHISLERDSNADKLFLWYFLDGNKEWVKYGEVDTTKRAFLKSSITSEDIEQHYLRNPRQPMIFKNDLFTYELDFIQMTQTNRSTNVVREVRRRPTPPQLSLLKTFLLQYR